MGLKSKIKRRLYERYFQWEVGTPPQLPDIEPRFWPLCETCKPFTMTSTERLYALYKAVEHVVSRDIPGNFVECGVWRGGSVMMMALALEALGATRHIHCFDTFEGMPPPTDADIRHDTGESAAAILARTEKKKDGEQMWAIASLDDVLANVGSTGYPLSLVSFEKGRVEETIPAAAPDQIALLRLDTDWYASTKHELEHLYPRLAPGGVLIIDDYGFWRGARQAVDEYLAGLKSPPFLARIDDTGRIAIAPS